MVLKKILFCSGVILLSSCVKKTEACFTYYPESVIVNEPVMFDASCSQSASLFEWTFGTSTADTSNHSDTISYTFTNTGSFEVKLKVTRKDGMTLGRDKYTISKTVIVK
jgi:PKD repeat protein